MSVLNSDHEVLFIHVPKTAGTSMERCHFLGGGGHQTIREYPQNQRLFKFGFVRNPWDRLVSAFFCHRPYDGGRDLAQFHQFVLEHCSDGEYPDDGIYRLHFLPMWHFLLDGNDRMGVDFVGRFEMLQSGWKYVCERLKVFAVLPHERKRLHRPYKEYYTPETWDVVGQLYQRDIELFGYGDDALHA